MTLSDVLTRIRGFLRTGYYPDRVAPRGHIPALALLRRRISDDEVISIATQLMSGGIKPIDGTDVGVAITKLTDDMPLREDTERVKRQLGAAGWPVSDAFGFPD